MPLPGRRSLTCRISFRAFSARTDFSKELPGIDSRLMSVAPEELKRVSPDGLHAFRADRVAVDHERAAFSAEVVASGAGAADAEVEERVDGAVAVLPLDPELGRGGFENVGRIGGGHEYNLRLRAAKLHASGGLARHFTNAGQKPRMFVVR